MKSNWKYACVGLIVLLVGIFSVSMYTQNKLKDKIIELQEQAPIVVEKEIHDTIYFDSIQVKWKTKYDTTEFIIRDTFAVADTIFIVQTEKCPLDSFYVDERYTDSIIDANIKIEGRGPYEKVFIDSVSLDYKIMKQEVKKKCCWLRRIFCGCE